MTTRKVLSRAQMFSQFFTIDDIARTYVELLKNLLESEGMKWEELYFIEPSAGEGAFVKYLPPDRTRAVEVDPELLQRFPSYIKSPLDKGGFLSLGIGDLGLEGIPREKIVIVGNPPYSVPKFKGRSNNVALDFVNHATKFGDTVAFILGNTFRRPVTQSKITRHYHLLYDKNVPQKSFIMDGKLTTIKTIFQVWRARYDPFSGSKILREIDQYVGKIKKGDWGGDWKFVKSIDPSANIRICNWGSVATVGKIDSPTKTRELVSENIIKKKKYKGSQKNYDPDQSHHYICAKDPDKVYEHFRERKYMFSELAADRTMGQNPDLSYVDFLRIYFTPLGLHYKEGKWS